MSTCIMLCSCGWDLLSLPQQQCLQDMSRESLLTFLLMAHLNLAFALALKALTVNLSGLRYQLPHLHSLLHNFPYTPLHPIQSRQRTLQPPHRSSSVHSPTTARASTQPSTKPASPSSPPSPLAGNNSSLELSQQVTSLSAGSAASQATQASTILVILALQRRRPRQQQ